MPQLVLLTAMVAVLVDAVLAHVTLDTLAMTVQLRCPVARIAMGVVFVIVESVSAILDSKEHRVRSLRCVPVVALHTACASMDAVSAILIILATIAQRLLPAHADATPSMAFVQAKTRAFANLVILAWLALRNVTNCLFLLSFDE